MVSNYGLQMGILPNSAHIEFQKTNEAATGDFGAEGRAQGVAWATPWALPSALPWALLWALPLLPESLDGTEPDAFLRENRIYILV